MKRSLLICALMLAACGAQPKGSTETLPSAPVAAAQRARIETLTTESGDSPACTSDHAWCAVSNTDAHNVTVNYKGRQVAALQFTDGEHEPWTQLVRMPRADGGEDVLLGVGNTVEQTYSGGGGQATQVSLYRLSSTGPTPRAPQPALAFPASGALDIRACFSEADKRKRRGACADQYNFTGTLSLDTSTAPPKLVLTTEATTYPAGISRNRDNTRPLAARDLRTVRDQTCSYRRVFTWDAALQTYKPDAPLPACSDYLEP